jgi:hypothetical protein
MQSRSEEPEYCLPMSWPDESSTARGASQPSATPRYHYGLPTEAERVSPMVLTAGHLRKLALTMVEYAHVVFFVS